MINLEPSGTVEAIKGRLDLLRQLNLKHLESHSDQLELEARIASFELAAKMQVEASGVLDLSKEPKETHDLYGTGNPETATYGRQCLLARRLVKRRSLRSASAPWAALGHPRAQRQRNPKRLQEDRPANGCITYRPQATGHAGRYIGDLGRGIWAHADV